MMKSLRKVVCNAIASAMILTAPAVATAQSDQDAVQEAVNAGQLKPLSEIRQVVQRRVQGRIVSTDLSANSIYSFRVLSPSGDMVNVKVNGQTAQVLSVKGGS